MLRTKNFNRGLAKAYAKKTIFLVFIFLMTLLLQNCSSGGGGGSSSSGDTTLTDAEAVTADAQNLDSADITFGPGDSDSSVTGNFTLPTSGENGTSISWTSNQPDYVSIAADGTVTVMQPNPATGDIAVTLIATISKGEESETKEITLTIKADSMAPANVSSFQVIAGDTEVNLSWLNPSDGDFGGVKILRKETDDISGPEDGSALEVYNGSAASHVDTALTNGTIYYYKAFSYDTAGNYASGVGVFARPKASTDTEPTLLSQDPEHNTTNIAPCSGTPCSGKIVLLFDESMDATQTSHILTTAIYDGSTYVNASNTTLTAVWSQSNVANDTLSIPISWLYWPENSQIRWSLDTGNLKDEAGNAFSATISDQVFTTTSNNVLYPVADTGQTGCYFDDGGTWTLDATCSESYTVGSATHPYGQDAHYVDLPDARSFTGPTQYGASDNYTTTDNVTGLVWRSCSQGQSGSNCQGTGSSGDNYGANSVQPSWYDALNQCSALNGSAYGGRTDWRLPTVAELRTLSNYGASLPAVDVSYFPATAVSYYWSSSSYIDEAGYVWPVNFADGFASNYSKASTSYMRCVSGSSGTEGSYTDNGDYTITDNATGLVWQKCSRGQSGESCADTAARINWQGALEYCENLDLGGRTDWRLPSLNELKSLLDRSHYNPAINTTYFPATVGSYYWSSSSYVGTNSAWRVNFYNDIVGYGDKTSVTHYARCVTSAP